METLNQQQVLNTIPSGTRPDSFERIDIREALSYSEFLLEYENKNRPVLLRGANKQWKAFTKWTPEFFKQNYGSTSVNIDGSEYRLSEFIDLVLDSSVVHPAPYLRAQKIAASFPQLMYDLTPELEYFSPNWLHDHFHSQKVDKFLHRLSAAELFIGGKGAGFPELHYDGFHTHAFSNQIYGKKEFILFSPSQTPFLYPRKNCPNVSRISNIERTDDPAFPLFSKANPNKCFLEPGDTLFIPCGWWHTTRILSPSISVSVNIANRSNWQNLSSDFRKSHHWTRFVAFILWAYLITYGTFKSISQLGEL